MNIPFFTKKKSLKDLLDEDRIIESICRAESMTSGEVRLYVENKNPLVQPLMRAKEIFYLLKMEHTKHRNAVLFYLAIEDQEFSIYGDEGIFQKHTQNEWKELFFEILEHFGFFSLF